MTGGECRHASARPPDALAGRHPWLRRCAFQRDTLVRRVFGADVVDVAARRVLESPGNAWAGLFSNGYPIRGSSIPGRANSCASDPRQEPGAFAALAGTSAGKKTWQQGSLPRQFFTLFSFHNEVSFSLFITKFHSHARHPKQGQKGVVSRLAPAGRRPGRGGRGGSGCACAAGVADGPGAALPARYQADAGAPADRHGPRAARGALVEVAYVPREPRVARLDGANRLVARLRHPCWERSDAATRSCA